MEIALLLDLATHAPLRNSKEAKMSILTTLDSVGMNELGIQVPVENQFEYTNPKLRGKNSVQSRTQRICPSESIDAPVSSKAVKDFSLSTAIIVFALLLLLVLAAGFALYQLYAILSSSSSSTLLNGIAGYRIYPS